VITERAIIVLPGDDDVPCGAYATKRRVGSESARHLQRNTPIKKKAATPAFTFLVPC